MPLPLSLGICFHREFAPPAVIEQARAAESAGFDEFWVIEDCFFTSGPTLAAAALTGWFVGRRAARLPADREE